MEASGDGKQSTDKVDFDEPAPTSAEADALSVLSLAATEPAGGADETGGLSLPGTPAPRPQASAPGATSSSSAAADLLARSAGHLPEDRSQGVGEDQDKVDIHTEPRLDFFIDDDFTEHHRRVDELLAEHRGELSSGDSLTERCTHSRFSFVNNKAAAADAGASSASATADLSTNPKIPSSADIEELVRNACAALAPQPQSGNYGWSPFGAPMNKGPGVETAEVNPGDAEAGAVTNDDTGVETAGVNAGGTEAGVTTSAETAEVNPGGTEVGTVTNEDTGAETAGVNAGVAETGATTGAETAEVNPDGVEAGAVTNDDTGAETAGVNAGGAEAGATTGAETAEVCPGDGGHAFRNGEEDKAFQGTVATETGASTSEFEAESSATGAEQDDAAASSAQGRVVHPEVPPMGGQGANYYGALIPYCVIHEYWVPIPYFTNPYCYFPPPMFCHDASSSSVVPYHSLGSGGGKVARYRKGERKTKPCYFWMAGWCHYGARCHYRHY